MSQKMINNNPHYADAAHEAHRLVVVLSIIATLTAVNLGFHALINGPDLSRVGVTEVSQVFFPGPLFYPWDRFMDYFRLQLLQPALGQVSALPPSSILMYQLGRLLTAATGPTISIAVFSLLQIALFSLSICRLLAAPRGVSGLDFSTRLALAVVISLCSYPIYFCIDRGNSALIVCALLNFAIDAHLRDKPWSAAILIGLAAALRITPLVFAAIYLSRRDFRYLLAAVATPIVAWGISLPVVALLLDGYTLDTWLGGFSAHSGMYTTATFGLGWSSSLYNTIRLLRFLGGIPDGAEVESALLAETAYSLFSFTFLLIILWRIRTADAITAFALLAWAFVALPHVTGDYYLALLIAPLIMLTRRQQPDKTTLCLFILLLVPKDYYYFYALQEHLVQPGIISLQQFLKLRAMGYNPTSIQALVINPFLLFWLGLRLARK
jgi:hypothetical protein